MSPTKDPSQEQIETSAVDDILETLRRDLEDDNKAAAQDLSSESFDDLSERAERIGRQASASSLGRGVATGAKFDSYNPPNITVENSGEPVEIEREDPLAQREAQRIEDIITKTDPNEMKQEHYLRNMCEEDSEKKNFAIKTESLRSDCLDKTREVLEIERKIAKLQLRMNEITRKIDKTQDEREKALSEKLRSEGEIGSISKQDASLLKYYDRAIAEYEAKISKSRKNTKLLLETSIEMENSDEMKRQRDVKKESLLRTIEKNERKVNKEKIDLKELDSQVEKEKRRLRGVAEKKRAELDKITTKIEDLSSMDMEVESNVTELSKANAIFTSVQKEINLCENGLAADDAGVKVLAEARQEAESRLAEAQGALDICVDSFLATEDSENLGISQKDWEWAMTAFNEISKNYEAAKLRYEDKSREHESLVGDLALASREYGALKEVDENLQRECQLLEEKAGMMAIGLQDLIRSKDGASRRLARLKEQAEKAKEVRESHDATYEELDRRYSELSRSYALNLRKYESESYKLAALSSSNPEEIMPGMRPQMTEEELSSLRTEVFRIKDELGSLKDDYDNARRGNENLRHDEALANEECKKAERELEKKKDYVRLRSEGFTVDPQILEPMKRSRDEANAQYQEKREDLKELRRRCDLANRELIQADESCKREKGHREDELRKLLGFTKEEGVREESSSRRQKKASATKPKKLDLALQNKARCALLKLIEDERRSNDLENVKEILRQEQIKTHDLEELLCELKNDKDTDIRKLKQKVIDLDKSKEISGKFRHTMEHVDKADERHTQQLREVMEKIEDQQRELRKSYMQSVRLDNKFKNASELVTACKVGYGSVCDLSNEKFDICNIASSLIRAGKEVPFGEDCKFQHDEESLTLNLKNKTLILEFEGEKIMFFDPDGPVNGAMMDKKVLKMGIGLCHVVDLNGAIKDENETDEEIQDRKTKVKRAKELLGRLLSQSGVEVIRSKRESPSGIDDIFGAYEVLNRFSTRSTLFSSDLRFYLTWDLKREKPLLFDATGKPLDPFKNGKIIYDIFQNESRWENCDVTTVAKSLNGAFRVLGEEEEDRAMKLGDLEDSDELTKLTGLDAAKKIFQVNMQLCEEELRVLHQESKADVEERLQLANAQRLQCAKDLERTDKEILKLLSRNPELALAKLRGLTLTIDEKAPPFLHTNRGVVFSVPDCPQLIEAIIATKQKQAILKDVELERCVHPMLPQYWVRLTDFGLMLFKGEEVAFWDALIVAEIIENARGLDYNYQQGHGLGLKGKSEEVCPTTFTIKPDGGKIHSKAGPTSTEFRTEVGAFDVTSPDAARKVHDGHSPGSVRAERTGNKKGPFSRMRSSSFSGRRNVNSLSLAPPPARSGNGGDGNSDSVTSANNSVATPGTSPEGNSKLRRSLSFKRIFGNTKKNEHGK